MIRVWREKPYLHDILRINSLKTNRILLLEKCVRNLYLILENGSRSYSCIYLLSHSVQDSQFIPIHRQKNGLYSFHTLLIQLNYYVFSPWYKQKKRCFGLGAIIAAITLLTVILTTVLATQMKRPLPIATTRTTSE